MIHSHSHKSVPSFSDPEGIQRLRTVLDAANYTSPGVLEVLNVKEFPSIRERDVPLLLRLTSGGTPIETLIRLFLIEVPVDIAALQKAIQPMEIGTWIEAGLVRIEKGSVLAEVKLLPFQNLLVAFDLDRRLTSGKGFDYVMGIGKSSLTLANLTVRRPARCTLDLGTGCGIQALLAAPHSDRVVAVDRNPRAVRIAAFNAQLNGMSHVECLEGDLFGPVTDHTFDLIVSNPPFVISPEMRYIYRDSGMEADRICQAIVRQAPKFLNEGGTCQILCNWAEVAGQDWRERLAGWFEGTGCDAWVMRSETRDAATYASTWIRHTERVEDDAAQVAQRLEEWMAYYEQQKIVAVSAGMITLCRAGGKANWFRADEAPEKMLGPCGDDIVRGFEVRNFLETLREDSSLLNASFHFSSEVLLDRQSAPSYEGWVEKSVQLHLTKGLAYTGNIDSYVANLVIKCNGKRPLKELLAEMSVSLGVDPVNITSAFCGIMRRLIEQGFLLPPHLAGRTR